MMRPKQGERTDSFMREKALESMVKFQRSGN